MTGILQEQWVESLVGPTCGQGPTETKFPGLCHKVGPPKRLNMAWTASRWNITQAFTY